jgi:hypothetical protein
VEKLFLTPPGLEIGPQGHPAPVQQNENQSGEGKNRKKNRMKMMREGNGRRMRLEEMGGKIGVKI